MIPVDANEMRQRYRNTFSTPEGRIVLGDIMSRYCHFGTLLQDDEERIEFNVGVSIAEMCGFMKEIDSLLGIKEK